MSRELLLTVIVHICVDQVNLDKMLLHAWFNVLFTISLCDNWAGTGICSPERSELALETQRIIWEHWLCHFSIGSSLFFWSFLIFFFLPSLFLSLLLLLCTSLKSTGDTYDHLRLRQARLQTLLVPDGQSLCLTQLQRASLTFIFWWVVPPEVCRDSWW